ncbi:MAG TPA: FAD/NAD(P)-binding oxidoreductase [Terracidiphilus sp.]|jgi:NADPH-dependent 2,4-dienoyl-CoA reductase/sulfur reductase-like enzyme|nr:FAD/NAD(P)-binding oxidoreductase [Terracidiphilus sp.]
MSASFDVIVAGAGPGGIAAATIAAEAGLHVCLLDDNAKPGGQIWRGFGADSARKYPHSHAYLEWSRRLERTACEVWSGWQAIDRLEASTLRLERDGEVQDLRFHKLILATGARERFLPFPGWTLPGVMGVGGLQALVKSGLEARGKRVVVAGTGPLLLAVAAGLAHAGAKIEGIYEQVDFSRLMKFGLSLAKHPEKLMEGACYRGKTLGAPYRTGCWVTRASGSDKFESVTITDGRKEWTHTCDWLACGFHLVPNLELPHLLGCRVANGFVVVNRLQQSSMQDIACAGELTGIGGLEKALLEGEVAGWMAAVRKDRATMLTKRVDRLRKFARQMEQTFALRDELRTLSRPETLVCRCEGVAHGALKECGSWREAKLLARCGMGACQGRVCGAAAEYLYGWQTAGTRPPVFPAAVSTVAAQSDVPEPIHT